MASTTYCADMLERNALTARPYEDNGGRGESMRPVVTVAEPETRGGTRGR